MKIVICGSIDFTFKIKEIADILSDQGHEVDIPLTSQRIINGELTLEDFLNEKNKNGDASFRESALRKIRDDVIKRYYHKIADSDVILVLNLDKKGIPNYIGGNTFLEMGFAHVLDKTIYLYNNIPDISYTDEINAMKPVILDGDLLKIK
jgi:nucleoside 2-deoxyribosyltransferase